MIIPLTNTVAVHTCAPGQQPCQPALDQHNASELKGREGHQWKVRGLGVADHLAWDADQAVWPRPHLSERHQRAEADHAPEGRSKAGPESTFKPCVAQLVNPNPDEEVVDPPCLRPVEPEIGTINETGQEKRDRDRPHPHRLPGGAGQRDQQDDKCVDRQEPRRHERDLGTDTDHPGRHADAMGHAGGDDPEQDEHQHRPQKASEPAAKPIPVRCAVPTGRIPGDPVGIASDEEEDGHHLHDPGQPLNPGGHIKQVADVGAVRIHPGRGHQPVARHHYEDRDRPQEINAAISLRRRPFRQSGGGAPKGLHANRQNNASPAAMDTPANAMVQGGQTRRPSRWWRLSQRP